MSINVNRSHSRPSGDLTPPCRSTRLTKSYCGHTHRLRTFEIQWWECPNKVVGARDGLPVLLVCAVLQKCLYALALHRRSRRRPYRRLRKHAVLALRMILSLAVLPAFALQTPFLEISFASSAMHLRQRPVSPLRVSLDATSKSKVPHAHVLLALAHTQVKMRQCRACCLQRPLHRRSRRRPYRRHRVRRLVRLAPFAVGVNSRIFRVLHRVSAPSFHRRNADWISLTRVRSVEADHNALQIALLVFATIAIAGHHFHLLQKSVKMCKNATSWILSSKQKCRTLRSPRRRCDKSRGLRAYTSASRTL